MWNQTLQMDKKRWRKVPMVNLYIGKCYEAASWKYTHPVNMGIPWFPFLRDFRDPVVIIGTPFSTQTADDTGDAL